MRRRTVLLCASLLALSAAAGPPKAGPDFYVVMSSCVFVYAKDGVAQSAKVDGHLLMCTRAGKKIGCLYRQGDSADKEVSWSVLAETGGDLTLSEGLAGADYLQASAQAHNATSTMRYAPGSSGIFGVRYCAGVYMTAWEYEAAQKMDAAKGE